MKKALAIASILALSGCNTVAVNNANNDDEHFKTTEHIDATELIDTYICYSITDYNKDHELLILASTRDDSELGIVYQSESIVHLGMHKVLGLERHWSFGCDEKTGRCDYRIDLEPDGTAHYFDFSDADEATSSIVMHCDKDADSARKIIKYIEQEFIEDDK